MKRTSGALLVVISVLALPLLVDGRRTPQKEKISPSVSADVRKELEKLLSSEQPQRLEGAYNLGNMGEKAASAIPFLVDVLQQNQGMVEVEKGSLKYFDKDTAFMVFGGKAATINPVQIVASDALVKIGKPAIQPLRAALSKADPAELPFAYVSEVLARMQDPATTKMLLGMLSDSNPHTRSGIADALGYSKDTATVDALIAALKDQDSGVKSSAAQSLKKITGQDYGEDASKWGEWRAKNKAKQ